MPKPREQILEQLETARRHVISGAAIVSRQQALVARLTADEFDTEFALDLLQQFEKSQAIFEQDFRDLERKLREAENSN